MKKYFKIIIIISVMAFLLWKAIVEPLIELISTHGLIQGIMIYIGNVLGFFILLIIFMLFIYSTSKIIDWILDSILKLLK